MSNTNQENSVTAPHDLYFLSGVSNLTSCSACAASQTSRFVKPCTIDFPPVPEHGLPLFLTPPAAGWAHLRSTGCVWCHRFWRRSEIIVQCRCVPPLLSTQAQRNPAEHEPVLKSLPIHWPTVPGIPLECDLSQTLGNREKLFYFGKKKKKDWEIVIHKVHSFPPQEVYTSLWNCSGAQRATH